jgi:hypothetical protein
METGTLGIGTPILQRMHSAKVTVAVPLYVVVRPFFVGLPVILKCVMVCLCSAVPFNITIMNVELKAGELELTFLKSHTPESIHAGVPFLPFWILTIVPDLEPEVCGCCALAIDAAVANAIIITRPTPQVMISGLAIKACLFFCGIKNMRV